MKPNLNFDLEIVDVDYLGKNKAFQSTAAKNVFVILKKKRHCLVIPCRNHAYLIHLPESVIPGMSDESYKIFDETWRRHLLQNYAHNPVTVQDVDLKAAVSPKTYFIDAELVCKLPFSVSPGNTVYMYSDRLRQICAYPNCDESPNYMRCLEIPSALSVPIVFTAEPGKTPYTTGEWISPAYVERTLRNLDLKNARKNEAFEVPKNNIKGPTVSKYFIRRARTFFSPS